MFSVMYLAQLVLCALLTRHYVSADDDEVKALMKVKPDGGLLNTVSNVIFRYFLWGFQEMLV